MPIIRPSVSKNEPTSAHSEHTSVPTQPSLRKPLPFLETLEQLAETLGHTIRNVDHHEIVGHKAFTLLLARNTHSFLIGPPSSGTLHPLPAPTSSGSFPSLPWPPRPLPEQARMHSWHGSLSQPPACLPATSRHASHLQRAHSHSSGPQEVPRGGPAHSAAMRRGAGPANPKNPQPRHRAGQQESNPGPRAPPPHLPSAHSM